MSQTLNVTYIWAPQKLLFIYIFVFFSSFTRRLRLANNIPNRYNVQEANVPPKSKRMQIYGTMQHTSVQSRGPFEGLWRIYCTYVLLEKNQL